MRRNVSLVIAAAPLLGALVFGMGSAGAVAGKAGPIAVTVTPTVGVADGQAVVVHATAPAGTKIYELRAHLCVPGKKLRSNFDFGFEGRRCTNAAVGAGDIERVAAFPSGVTAATLEGFKIGEGTVHWVNELGYDQTIDCGPDRPCDLVVRVQITNDTVFYSAPLCYGSACPAEGASTPTASTPTTSTSTTPGRSGSKTSTSGAGTPAIGAGRTSKTNPDGSPVSAGSPGARAAGRSGSGSSGAAAGASAAVATIAAPWPLSRTLLVGLIGALGGAGATLLLGRLRRRWSVRRATIGGTAIAVVALMLLLSGCSSSAKASGDPNSDGSTTGAPAGTAKITSFVVPKSVTCGTATSTKVRVTYAISGAKSTQLIIDGRVEPSEGPSATVDPLVHCDPLPHTVALVALDATGHRTSEVKNVTTVLPGG